MRTECTCNVCGNYTFCSALYYAYLRGCPELRMPSISTDTTQTGAIEGKPSRNGKDTVRHRSFSQMLFNIVWDLNSFRRILFPVVLNQNTVYLSVV